MGVKPAGNLIRPDRAALLVPGPRRQMTLAAAAVPDVISLGRGDPDIATPRHIIDAAKQALDAGHTHYTSWNGIAPLREAIADKLAGDNGLTVDPDDELLVTNGAQEALYIALQLLAGSGDDVLVADPHYASYDALVALAGARLVPVPTFEEESFMLTLRELRKAHTPRSRVLLLANPSNPTGAVFTEAQLREIGAFADRHQLWVIADEVYEKFLYDSTRHVSLGSLPRMAARTITVNSFSKTYAMTGWRMGYLAGPAAVITAAGELKYALNICISGATQMAALAALKGSQDHIPALVSDYDGRRKLLMRALGEMGLPYVRPQGGFTVFVNIRSTGMTSLEFCLRLLHDGHVQVYPGSMYGPAGEGYARVSFLATANDLERACRRIDRTVTAMRAALSQ